MKVIACPLPGADPAGGDQELEDQEKDKPLKREKPKGLILPHQRQVPENDSAPSYCLLGSGRLARHLDHYFSLLNLPLTRWSRKSGASLAQAIEPASVVLLAVSDQAIESLAGELSAIQRSDQVLVHFSGALSTPLAIGAHPLMTFGPSLYDLDTYEAIPFITESGAPREFSMLFPALRNPVHRIDPAQKALYHALCVMAGNFTTLLWGRLFEGFEQSLALPAGTALPYLRQTARNLAEQAANPAARALTGPIARRDFSTIEMNLAALSGDPFQGIYRAFVEALLPASAGKSQEAIPG